MNKIKTALYFGSFNPVHLGHIMVAEYISLFSDIEELWFVPTPENPLKNKKNLAPFYDRLKMLELAIQKYDKFKICDVEKNLQKPNYTAFTLEFLSQKYPLREFSLIIGSDILSQFSKWKNYEYLLKYYRFLIYPRGGFELDLSLFREAKYEFLNNAPKIEISSSMIRENIKKGIFIRSLLDDNVFKYLEKENIY